MLSLKLNRLEDYLAALEANPDLEAECRLCLTVSSSRFFRDGHLWILMESEILPWLSRGESIRAWSAGCACGEEAYSLKILHHHLQGRSPHLRPLKLLATDLNPVYLNKARAGVYQRSSLREVPAELGGIYFHELPGHRCQVAEVVKTDLHWQEHDLLSGLPLGIFDVIFMRNNVLTYNQDNLKKMAVRTAAASLAPGGFLIIGARETLGPAHPHLRSFQGRSDVFQKKSGG